jgi:hypothetical protein
LFTQSDMRALNLTFCDCARDCDHVNNYDRTHEKFFVQFQEDFRRIHKTSQMLYCAFRILLQVKINPILFKMDLPGKMLTAFQVRAHIRYHSLDTLLMFGHISKIKVF